jgi:hypothetical protein
MFSRELCHIGTIELCKEATLRGYSKEDAAAFIPAFAAELADADPHLRWTEALPEAIKVTVLTLEAHEIAKRIIDQDESTQRAIEYLTNPTEEDD